MLSKTGNRFLCSATVRFDVTSRMSATSALAPVIRLGYVKMVVMALPYTVVLTLVGFLAQ